MAAGLVDGEVVDGDSVVDCVVVSVVPLVEGGTANVDWGGELLPGLPETNSAARTAATPNSTTVAAISATCAELKRDFRSGASGVGAGGGHGVYPVAAGFG